ncbi:outer membrane protein assembly factor BamB [Luteimonas sp. RD2P54]|uniref:Outer membrane protein assembly factor BamB n=2 Tax=Luteimonas endophytica TaxID=3042023 RepID=A0ABT6J3R2_9GAMM|nr:outer membrane protein assembly factor BamB [Luteimonas endophytica]MDH5821454.1 outer membrane protein assembly factor BamB [Luteimonas endophytica]
MLRAVIALSCVLAVSGCSTVRGWFDGDDDEVNTTEPAELTDFAPSASVDRLWTAGVGKGERRIGARQSPAVAGGRVYAAALTGGVHAFDLQSGAAVWHHESELPLSGGPGVGEGLVVAGSLEGDVLALDAQSGAERWRAEVGNEVIAAPAIGQGVVVVRSNDGRVSAFDATNGERLWFWVRDLPALTVRGNDAPVLGPGYVFVGNDDGTVIALGLNDGRPIWEQAVGQPDGRTDLERMADVDGSPVLDDVVLYASSYKGQTMAIEAPSGRPLWSSDHGGSGRVGVATDRLVVADPAGTVWALDKNGGTVLWQQDALARRDLSSAAVHDGYAVVGDFDGYLHWLRLENGELAARTRAGRAAIKGAPVVADGVLVVQTVEGDLSAYRVGQ